MSSINIITPSRICVEKFGNLGLGTPFMFIDGNVYMKIDEVYKYDSGYHKQDYNTICLNDGRLEWTDDIAMVTLVHAHVGVEYKHKSELHYE